MGTQHNFFEFLTSVLLIVVTMITIQTFTTVAYHPVQHSAKVEITSPFWPFITRFDSKRSTVQAVLKDDSTLRSLLVRNPSPFSSSFTKSSPLFPLAMTIGLNALVRLAISQIMRTETSQIDDFDDFAQLTHPGQLSSFEEKSRVPPQIMLNTRIYIPRHGYVSKPKSRVYMCKEMLNKNCGRVIWEPQSVEGQKGFPKLGPSDGHIVGAGIFEELDEYGPNRWRKVNIAPLLNTINSTHVTLRLHWQYTTRHKTSAYHLFGTIESYDASEEPLKRSNLQHLDTVVSIFVVIVFLLFSYCFLIVINRVLS